MSVIKTPHSISFCRPAIKGVFIGNGLGGGGLARDLHNAEQYGRAWQLFLHAHNLMTTMSWHNNEMRLQAFGSEPHVNFILLTLRISRLTQKKNTHVFGGIGNYPWICQNLSGLAPNKQRTIFIFGYEYIQNWR